jgi:hypothetical protein
MRDVPLIIERVNPPDPRADDGHMRQRGRPGHRPDVLLIIERVGRPTTRAPPDATGCCTRRVTQRGPTRAAEDAGAVVDPAVHPDAALVLPSAGPEPILFADALAAVVGYARARRPLRFRSPGVPDGRWVRVPAYGWTRFDAAAPSAGHDADVLLGEGLHGRLDRDGWHDAHDALARVRPLVDEAVVRADGHPLWALPPGEFSVLDEPGTVGSLLRRIAATAGSHPGHVLAALHHRHRTLVPHLTRTTRRALLPHLEEGDSGVEAVVRRELVANAAVFAALETATARATGDAAPSRLRLHDILLWLVTTLRWAHAVREGASARAR